MRLLLDTHIWIWSHAEAHKLSSEVARELTNPQNERYLSAVSVWETILLLEKKRIRSKGDFLDWFKRSKLALGLIEVPLNWEIAREIRYTTLGYRSGRPFFGGDGESLRPDTSDRRRTADAHSGLEGAREPVEHCTSFESIAIEYVLR